MIDPAMTTAQEPTLIDGLAVDRFREMQRFAELGRLSAGLLHEISNPLTAALLHLEQYENRNSTNIRHARRNMLVLDRYVKAARQQLRQADHPANFYVRTQLTQVRRVLVPLARRAGVKIRFELPANYRMFGDPVKLQQIITNLVVNAIDSYKTLPRDRTPRQVNVTITVRGPWVVLKVWDRGIGIDTDQIDKLFVPFYTTKAATGEGLGIGLTMVRQYVENDFYGSILVTSSPRRGTQFTVKLRAFPRYQRNNNLKR